MSNDEDYTPRWYDKAMAALEADLDAGDITWDEFKEAVRELNEELNNG